MNTGGNPIVYHTDGLGSVRARTDPSGAIVETYQYDEYGNVVASQGSVAQPFQYTGEQHDDYTKFVYLRSRYYDPQIGEFTSRDTWPGTPNFSGTMNRFAYVGGNPINATDPLGMCPTPSLVGGVVDCEKLLQRIQSRTQDLLAHLEKFPESSQISSKEMAAAVEGHVKEWTQKRDGLNKMLNQWYNQCGHSGLQLPSELYSLPARITYNAKSREVDLLWEKVQTVGAAFVVYRVVRFMLSAVIPGGQITLVPNLLSP